MTYPAARYWRADYDNNSLNRKRVSSQPETGWPGTMEQEMPIYEYQCQKCEHQFEVIQKVNADLLKDCPECSQPALVKLVSAPSFRLKGGGWYETDFKKDKRKNLAGDKDSSAANDAGAKKAESKGSDSSGGSESKKAPAKVAADSSVKKAAKPD